MFGVNIDYLKGEEDREKLRSAAIDLARRNMTLEAENTVLLRRVMDVTEELAKCTDRNRQVALNLQLKKINEQLAQRNKELYGSSRSERRPGPEEAKPEEKEEKRRKGHGPKKQTKLPFQEVTHKRADAEAPCPSCAQPQPEMAGQTEDSEQITFIERKIVLCVHKRQKYRCTLCGRIDTADGAPAPLIPGGRYSPEFGIAVGVDKYADHLPLERQVDRFARQGLEVSSQTLWDQLVALYHLLLPVYLALRTYLLAKAVLGVDESPWRMMEGGRSARWWTWVMVGEDAVFYMLAPTRGRAAARELLDGYQGILSADGYAVYSSLEELGRQASLFQGEGSAEDCGFTLVCCWMHARRGFIRAEKNHPEAKDALVLIQRLYRVEVKAKEEAEKSGVDLLVVRRRLRDTESRAIIEELRAWLDKQKPVPTLQLDKAIQYTKNQWTRLVRFLEDPRAPLDNGWAERAIRGTVLGRKNHYGSHSELGMRVAALFYSLMETCKLLDVEPSGYLLEAVKRSRRNREDVLTPMAWKAELAQAAAPPPVSPG